MRDSNLNDEWFRSKTLIFLASRLNFLKHGLCVLIDFIRTSAFEELVHMLYTRVTKAIVKLGKLFLGEETFVLVVPSYPQMTSIPEYLHGRTIVKYDRVLSLIDHGRLESILIIESKNERNVRILRNGSVKLNDRVVVRKLESSNTDTLRSTASRDCIVILQRSYRSGVASE